MTAFDLDAYLARIGYEGSRVPSLDTLRALQLTHVQAIAFENLNPLLDLPVPIDIPALEAKIVRGRRGGYCHEQNTLFCAALTALGFVAHCVGARVYLDRAADAGIPARTHLAVRVEIEGQAYHADVGFGGQTPTGPLRLDTEAAQETPHEPYRILAAAEEPDHESLALEAKVAGEWKLLYRFDLAEPPPVDTLVANHYVATHPNSGFRKSLLVARTAPDGRHTLLNDRLGFHRLGGATERKKLADADALIVALRDVFGLDVPDAGKLASIFPTLKTP